jgi:hypothetical protein
MGRSTVRQLIQRAKNMNEYNNSGVSNDVAWLDHFNTALVEMVDDLNLEETFEINYTLNQQAYDLPEDYYSLILLNDKATNQRLTQKRHYDQIYPPGYWVLDKGDRHVVEITYNTPTTFIAFYERYPRPLEFSEIETQKPEIPTAGETALCYKAISHALRNNNQLGQAQYYDALFKEQLSTIKTASTRGRGV